LSLSFYLSFSSGLPLFLPFFGFVGFPSSR
jgi:hypothetical protein